MGKRLNENQNIAVNHNDGPMLVLAGPGSGKTTVILCRIRRLLKETHMAGQGMLVVTFTKAAATQMKERFPYGGTQVLFATFHSIFYRILRSAYQYPADAILGEEEKRKALLGIIAQKEWVMEDPEELVGTFIAQASFMRNELLSLAEFVPEGVEADQFRDLFRAYAQYKARGDKLDFDDMLVQCYELLKEDEKIRAYWQEKFPYIMVDEFQDVNRVQYECLRLLAAPKNNLFVVGDDDQSIYGFRGARPDYLLEFEREFPGSQKVVLNVNYRSSSRIISLAERVIGTNSYRFEKGIQGAGGKGEKIRFFLSNDTATEGDMVAEKIALLLEEGIPLRQIAVIYRTNIQGGAFARALHRKGIPYILKDGGMNIYDHWIARDLLAYLILGESEDGDSALRQIINKPKRYIGKELLAEAEGMPYGLLRGLAVCSSLKRYQSEQLESLRADLKQVRKRKPYEAISYIRKVIGYDEYLEEYAAFRHGSGQVFLEIADELMEISKEATDMASFRQMLEEMGKEMQEQRKQQNQEKNGIILSTMHASKGLEFYAVFLPTLVEGVVPHEKGVSPKALEEERRLFYVALTRTKERLCVSAVKSRYNKETLPSRFLKEMGLDVEEYFNMETKGKPKEIVRKS